MNFDRPMTSPFASIGARAAIDARTNRTGGGPQAWHEMMDICKESIKKFEGMSDTLIHDMRAEVVEAVNAFRREANSVNVSADRPVGMQINRLEERLRMVEDMIASTPPPDIPSVNKNLREVELSCLSASRLLGDQLQKMSESHRQLHEKLADPTTVDILEKIMDKMSRLDKRSERSEEEVGKVQCSVQGAAEQIVGEVQKLKNQEEHNFSVLEKTCEEAGLQVQRGLDSLSQKSERIVEQIGLSGSSISKTLNRIEGVVQESGVQIGDMHTMTSKLSEVIAREIAKVSKQDDRHYTELGFFMESSLCDQRSQLADVRTSLETNLEPLNKTLAFSQRQQTLEFRTLLTELARVQQALNVDYVRAAAMADAIEPDPDTSHHHKRYREFYTQTFQREKQTAQCQTDPIGLEDSKRSEEIRSNKSRRQRASKKHDDPLKRRMTMKPAFAGADKLKQAAKDASMKPQYNVFDYYKERGCCQAIAKSNIFEYSSLLMVIVNAIWLAVDTDLNPETLLINSSLPFLIMENVFCGYFFLELLIRFLAFQFKCKAFKDAWFVFDLFLVLLMVVETWVVPGVMFGLNFQPQTGSSGTDGSMSLLRMFKIFKLVRLTRMARLLRSVPELIIIVKGLVFAARSVTVFFLLWGMIVYVFAVLFRQITEDSEIGNNFFKTVPHAMNTLLLNGVFNSNADLTVVLAKNIMPGNFWLWPLLIFFMALVSLTLMYMLVGVLVDVVGVVATSEKEGIAVQQIASAMRVELKRLGFKDDAEFSLTEFQVIMSDASVIRFVQSVGVDVAVLADMIDVTYEQYSKGRKMKFPDLVESILNMRGTNPATVKDFKEQLKITKTIFKESLSEFFDDLREENAKMVSDLREYGSDSDLSDNEGAAGVRSPKRS